MDTYESMMMFGREMFRGGKPKDALPFFVLAAGACLSGGGLPPTDRMAEVESAVEDGRSRFERSGEAAVALVNAAQCHTKLGDHAHALRCACAACNANPAALKPRYVAARAAAACGDALGAAQTLETYFASQHARKSGAYARDEAAVALELLAQQCCSKHPDLASHATHYARSLPRAEDAPVRASAIAQLPLSFSGDASDRRAVLQWLDERGRELLARREGRDACGSAAVPDAWRRIVDRRRPPTRRELEEATGLRWPDPCEYECMRAYPVLRPPTVASMRAFYGADLVGDLTEDDIAPIADSARQALENAPPGRKPPQDVATCMSTTCAVHYLCVDTPHGAICKPTCAVVPEGTCGSGRHCVDTEHGARCAEDRPCSRMVCPRGATCVDGPAYGRCVPTIPEVTCANLVCGPGYHCEQMDPTFPATCVPDGTYPGTTCETLRCEAGFHCEQMDPTFPARCVPDSGVPRRAATIPGATCETLRCRAGFHCEQMDPTFPPVCVLDALPGVTCANLRCMAGFHCEQMDPTFPAECVRDAV
eukprot:m51a1_g4340 hypothetical protein (538) ;mRNA; r:187294-190156